jgi:hypothetical protein
MALTQGAPLPDVTTTQTQTTTAPDWYNNYLSGLASAGQTAAETGGVAGFSDLQNQAFAGAPAAVQAGQPALQAATQAATGVATTPFMQNISQYMNPYTQQVIENINRLGQRQFRETLAPAATAGAVGSGQFGSKRGMQVYGNVARDVNADILGKQSEYMAKGFDAATAAAKAQADLNLQASGRLGELSNIGYQQGVGGLDVLSKLGAQKQAQEQARLDYPMTAAGKQAALLRGFQIPTSQTQRFTGPMPGAYQKSDLDYILQGLATTGALFTPTQVRDATGKIVTTTPAGMFGSGLKGVFDLIFPKNTGATPVWNSGYDLPMGGDTTPPVDTGGGSSTWTGGYDVPAMDTTAPVDTGALNVLDPFYDPLAG